MDRPHLLCPRKVRLQVPPDDPSALWGSAYVRCNVADPRPDRRVRARAPCPSRRYLTDCTLTGRTGALGNDRKGRARKKRRRKERGEREKPLGQGPGGDLLVASTRRKIRKQRRKKSIAHFRCGSPMAVRREGAPSWLPHAPKGSRRNSRVGTPARTESLVYNIRSLAWADFEAAAGGEFPTITSCLFLPLPLPLCVCRLASPFRFPALSRPTRSRASPPDGTRAPGWAVGPQQQRDASVDRGLAGLSIPSVSPHLPQVGFRWSRNNAG